MAALKLRLPPGQRAAATRQRSATRLGVYRARALSCCTTAAMCGSSCGGGLPAEASCSGAACMQASALPVGLPTAACSPRRQGASALSAAVGLRRRPLTAPTSRPAAPRVTPALPAIPRRGGRAPPPRAAAPPPPATTIRRAPVRRRKYGFSVGMRNGFAAKAPRSQALCCPWSSFSPALVPQLPRLTRHRTSTGLQARFISDSPYKRLHGR